MTGAEVAADSGRGGRRLRWIAGNDFRLLENGEEFFPRVFECIAAAQREVDRRWSSRPEWNAATIRNVARVGWFSSDRTIGEYAREIWGIM